MVHLSVCHPNFESFVSQFAKLMSNTFKAFLSIVECDVYLHFYLGQYFQEQLFCAGMTGHMVLGKATLSDTISNIQVHF